MINQLQDINISADVMTSEQVSSFVEDCIRKIDYTSFEVFPTDMEISAGTIDSLDSLGGIFGWDKEDEYIKNQNFTGLEYKVPAEAGQVLYIYFRMSDNPSNSDITIDWGDGTCEKLSEIKVEAKADGNVYSCGAVHDYSTVENAINKKHIVKIYGSNYQTLRFNYNKSAYPVNIISRIFDVDLPHSKCLVNVSSAVANAQRLLKINFQKNFSFKNLVNLSGTFRNCKNLQNVVLSNYDVNKPFNSVSGIFSGCINLNMDIKTLLPLIQFGDAGTSGDWFTNCSSLYGTVDMQKFLNSSNHDYSKLNKLLGVFISSTEPRVISNISESFYGCSDAIRQQVPSWWGGTFDDFTRYGNKYYLNYKDGTYGIIDLDELYPNGKWMKITVEIPTDNCEFKFNLGKNGNKYIFIDWGDCLTTVSMISGHTCSHVYKKRGTYVIQIPLDYYGKVGDFDLNIVSINNHLDEFASTAKYVTKIECNSPRMKDDVNGAFFKAINLKTVDLPYIKTLNGAYTFIGCTSIQTVNLDSLEQMEQRTFENCSSLLSISLPSIKKIGNDSFKNCSSLETVDFSKLTDCPTINQDATDLFGGCHRDMKIRISEAHKDKWTSNAKWNTISAKFKYV